MSQVSRLVDRLQSTLKSITDAKRRLGVQTRQATQDISTAIAHQIDSLRRRERELRLQVESYQTAKSDQLTENEAAIASALSNLKNAVDVSGLALSRLESALGVIGESSVDFTFWTNDDAIQEAITSYGTVPDDDDDDCTDLVAALKNFDAGAPDSMAFWLRSGSVVESDDSVVGSVRDGVRRLQQSSESVSWLQSPTSAGFRQWLSSDEAVETVSAHSTSSSYSLKHALDAEAKRRDRVTSWLLAVDSEPPAQSEPTGLASALESRAAEAANSQWLAPPRFGVAVGSQEPRSEVAEALAATLMLRYGNNSELWKTESGTMTDEGEAEDVSQWLSRERTRSSHSGSFASALERLSLGDGGPSSWLLRSEGESSLSSASGAYDSGMWLAPAGEVGASGCDEMQSANEIVEGLKRLKREHSLQNWLRDRVTRLESPGGGSFPSGSVSDDLLAGLRRHHDDSDLSKWLQGDDNESGESWLPAKISDNDYSHWLAAPPSAASGNSAFCSPKPKFELGFDVKPWLLNPGGGGDGDELFSEVDSQDFEILSRGNSSLDEDWVH